MKYREMKWETVNLWIFKNPLTKGGLSFFFWAHVFLCFMLLILNKMEKRINPKYVEHFRGWISKVIFFCFVQTHVYGWFSIRDWLSTNPHFINVILGIIITSFYFYSKTIFDHDNMMMLASIITGICINEKVCTYYHSIL